MSWLIYRRIILLKMQIDYFKIYVRINKLTGSRGSRGQIFVRGKSELHRAACRVTPGESNLEDSVIETETTCIAGKGGKVR